MNPVKIIRIQSRICIGGPAIHTELLSLQLVPKGYETLLVGGAVDASEKNAADKIRQRGIHLQLIAAMGRNLSLINDVRSGWQLYRLFRREKPQIVHTHTAKAGAVGRVAAWLARVPIIVHTFHGHIFHHYFGPKKTRFFILLERLLAKISDHIIVISQRQYEDIVNHYHVSPPEKTSIIPLGFDLTAFFSIQKKQIHRKKLGLKNSDFLAAIIGRMVPIKNIQMALDVVIELKRQHFPFHLCLVGDGNLRDSLEKYAQEHAITAQVHFMGWQENMPEIYSGIDLLLLTSNNEGTPVTIIEAQACQVPVIATAVGGVPDIIIPEKTGWLVPAGATAAMTERILQIAAHPDACREITTAARKAVASRFHYTRLIQKIDELYRNLLT